MMSFSSLVSAPPHSLESERIVLGALLLDPDAMIHVAAVLTPEDFYDPVYGSIYRAIRRLYDARTPIDFITVTEALRGHEQVERLGGSAFIAELASEVPTAAHAKQYAEIVRTKSLRRELSRVGTAI